VRLHILVHELVHCIGLTNCAHSDDDVFIGKLVMSLGGTVNGKALPRDGSGSIPALKLGAKTIMKIKKAWEIPLHSAAPAVLMIAVVLTAACEASTDDRHRLRL
jgi:hypothetical protein